MGELIPFPKSPIHKAITEGKNSPLDKVSTPNVLMFPNKATTPAKELEVQSFLSENNPRIAVGNEVIVKVLGKKYRGIVTTILKQDTNGNVTKIAYIIPFLHGDDPLKFGESTFNYSIKKHD